MTRLLLLIMLCVTAGYSQTESWNVQPTSDFEVTGDGKNEAWNRTPFTTLTPRKGPRDRYKTDVKILYSTTGIYCLFVCRDEAITSTLREDYANLFKEDVVEIFFWPDSKMTTYFEYELSPYAFELGIIVPNIEGKFFGWRPWHYEGERKTRRKASIQKNDKGVTGWTAEFFIPYQLLKPLVMQPPKAGDRWRVNVYRIDYDQDVTLWSWRPFKKDFHDYESFGTMEFH